jgi:hypothetical protein
MCLTCGGITSIWQSLNKLIISLSSMMSGRAVTLFTIFSVCPLSDFLVQLFTNCFTLAKHFGTFNRKDELYYLLYIFNTFHNNNEIRMVQVLAQNPIYYLWIGGNKI